MMELVILPEIIRVEYEWKPPHCVDCKNFGHSHDKCPKTIADLVHNETPTDDCADGITNVDGFTKVTKHKNNVKNACLNQSHQIGGIKLSKPKANFQKSASYETGQ